MWQGVLGVFLREPLADWQREARLLQAGADNDAEEKYISLKACFTSTGFGWPEPKCSDDCIAHSELESAPQSDICDLPQVAFAKRRLSGDHPAELTVAELATRHKHKPHWAALQVCRHLHSPTHA